jgi:hypothetical protein
MSYAIITLRKTSVGILLLPFPSACTKNEQRSMARGREKKSQQERLWKASKEGDVVAVRALLKRRSVNVNAGDFSWVCLPSTRCQRSRSSTTWPHVAFAGLAMTSWSQGLTYACF